MPDRTGHSPNLVLGGRAPASAVPVGQRPWPPPRKPEHPTHLLCALCREAQGHVSTRQSPAQHLGHRQPWLENQRRAAGKSPRSPQGGNLHGRGQRAAGQSVPGGRNRMGKGPGAEPASRNRVSGTWRGQGGSGQVGGGGGHEAGLLGRGRATTGREGSRPNKTAPGASAQARGSSGPSPAPCGHELLVLKGVGDPRARTGPAGRGSLQPPHVGASGRLPRVAPRPFLLSPLGSAVHGASLEELPGHAWCSQAPCSALSLRG